MEVSGRGGWGLFTFPDALKASIFWVRLQRGPPLKGESVKQRSVLSAIKGCIDMPRNKLEHHLAQLLLVRIPWQGLCTVSAVPHGGQQFEEDTSASYHFKVPAYRHSVSLHLKAETQMAAQASVWFTQEVLELEMGKPPHRHQSTTSLHTAAGWLG